MEDRFRTVGQDFYLRKLPRKGNDNDNISQVLPAPSPQQKNRIILLEKTVRLDISALMAARLSLPLKTRCFPSPGHPEFSFSMRLILIFVNICTIYFLMSTKIL
jgi:hypothetical protein